MSSTTIRDNVAIGEPNLTGAVSPNSNGSSMNTYSVSNVGAFATSGDGRSFRFAYDGGTALVAGALLQGTATDDTNLHDLTCASVAVNDTTVSITSTASTIAANALAGGYLTFTGSGGGQTYAIAGNTAAASSAFTITLADPIRVALTTPAADTIYSQFYGVVAMPTTATSTPIGAALVATAGTQFAWIQTEGPIALQNDNTSTIAVGAPVTFSASTAGYITAASNHTTQAIVGFALEAIEGTQFGLVQLMLD